MGLHKILKIVALILSIAGVVSLAMIVSDGDDVVKATGDGLDGFLYIAYIMFALVLFFVIIFVLKGLMAGDIKKTLITVGAFLVVVVISYVMADGVETIMKDGKTLSESGSRWISTGINAFVLLGIIAIGSMIFGGVKKIISK
ncbi:MAG: Na+/proline symporter [Sediminicola sp.]|jgi:Na+/proline symporter|tara:strand:+ start:589 stop:1017 length:429 start_codon:yes stop_codon:yes gene_type:complete